MTKLPHTVSRSVLLDAPAERVWEAVTDESALAEWLAPEVELEPHEGGEIVCRYEDGEERRGQVELVEEAERLAFQWRRQGAEPSRVELVLDSVAERTILTVTETAGPSACVAPRLGALRALLRGRLVLA